MITLTESASNKIKENLSKRGTGVGIRLGVKTTGCSGLAYVIEYVDTPTDVDVSFVSNGVQVFVDPKSAVYLDQVELNWIRKGLNEGFDFTNPKEKARCGCGESFSI
jgi:iron-sulfur cluster assembly protein